MIHIDTLSKTFSGGKGLDRVSLHIKPGEMVALIGSSGSGKSTLMRHIAGLMPGDADGGRIEVAQHLIQDRGVISRDIRTMRAEIGMVFQQFNLVDRMSVLRNVMLGALSRTALWRSLLGFFHEEDARLAYKALARVGIMEKAHQRTSNLSGGQQQRAAIARALVQRARVLLADEPIASLDPESSRNVMETLRDLNQKDGLTVLVTLHQVDYALSFCPPHHRLEAWPGRVRRAECGTDPRLPQAPLRYGMRLPVRPPGKRHPAESAPDAGSSGLTLNNKDLPCFHVS